MLDGILDSISLEYILEHRRYLNIVGIFLVLACAWFFSRNRNRINLRVVVNGLALQVLIAFLTLKTAIGQACVTAIAGGITHLYLYAEEGSRFLFGSLSQAQEPWGFIFAFRVLPVIIFFAAFIALLLHYRILQLITLPINFILYRLLGTSAAETLCSISNCFLGQTEAPLLVRGYLHSMTQSEILTVMVSGMGTISGPLLAVYAAMGVPLVYLLSASAMAIPATIVISKILLPETHHPETARGLHTLAGDEERTVFDAIAIGTSDGLRLALAVGAMLIASVALIAAANGVLGWFSTMLQHWAMLGGLAWKIPTLTLQSIFGYAFAPVGWLLGLTGDEMLRAGELLGIKLSINEMVAYATMVGSGLSTRAVALLTFALCGFANFSSIGIQIAGIGALAPDQQKTLSRLGLRAVLGSTLANLLSAFIVGLMI